MKNTFHLSLSIARHNKGFTIGLIVLFMILASSIMMVRYLTTSVRETIEDYTEEYNAPDLWIVSEPLPASISNQFSEYPEIISHEYSMMMDVNCKAKNQVFTLALTSIENDGFRKYYKDETKHPLGDMPEVQVSSYFAKINGIEAGNTIEIMTDNGYKEFFVSAIVSCPENMYCTRDSTSWCDSADFGYLYLSREVMNEHFPVKGYANFWSFHISDDCSNTREEKILNELSETFGEKLISSERFATSNVKVQLENELKQMDKAIQYMPYLQYLLGLFFTGLFIQNVMLNQRKTIGLLQALGYSNRQILFVFILYTCMTNIIGLILGIGVGRLFTEYTIGIYKNTYSLPYVHFSTDIPILILLLIIPLFIGIVSCISRISIITKMNPAEAYGGFVPQVNEDLPQWLMKLEVSEMVKIAIVSIYRNSRRFIISVVCIGATIIISFVSIAISISNNAALTVTFGSDTGQGGRFRYDALIHNSGSDDFIDLVRETDGVKAAEPVIVFKTTLNARGKELDAQLNAISKNSKLIVPRNTDGRISKPKDGIILEEVAARELGVKVGDKIKAGDVSLEVKGIARETVNSIQYISFETAEKLGYDAQNEIAVSYQDDADFASTGAELSQLPGFGYSVIRDHQKLSVVNGCRAKNIAVYMCCVLALILGIVIVFNMVSLSVEEKKLDYATMIALGASVKDFLKMAFTENILRYVFAIGFGIPLAYYIAIAVMNGMSSVKTSYPFIQQEKVLLITMLISIIYLVGGVIFMLWKVKSVEPSEALNARE